MTTTRTTTQTTRESHTTAEDLFGEDSDGLSYSEEEDSEEGENNHNNGASHNSELKDYNYTEDRLDAVRKKLKRRYDQISEQKAQRNIVTLEEAPMKKKGSRLSIVLKTPTSTSHTLVNNKQQNIPAKYKVLPTPSPPTNSKSPSALNKNGSKAPGSTRDRIMKKLNKKGSGSGKPKSSVKTHTS